MGLLLPLAAILTWRRLTEIDATARIATEPLDLLRTIPIFAPLPHPCSNGSRRLPPKFAYPWGRPSSTRPGRRPLLCDADGTARVEIDGTQTSTLAPGGFFGEIALLRDVPRTATVRAAGELRLYALERDDFIAAVTGHAPSREAADSVVTSRLLVGAAA